MTNKSLLFVAVFSDTSTNNAQSRGLQRAGCDVIEYNYRIRASDIGARERDLEIINICQKECVDIVLFSKCNGVHFSVIEECNRTSKTVLWYMDPLHNFNDELIEKIKRCTYTFCALVEPYIESKKYSQSIYFLQEGFDSAVNFPIDMPYKHDVSFIGSLRGERSSYHRKYGFHNYTNAYGKEHSVAVSESIINLNFTDGGTSDRSYKVLASMGFLLTQPWPDMEDDFIIDKDLVTFCNEKEFETKVKYYLNNEKERKIIVNNGYLTVQKFSRDNWAQRLLDVIND